MDMPWGKYRGLDLTDDEIPSSYLMYLLEVREWGHWEQRLKEAVADELRRRVDSISEPSMCQEVIPEPVLDWRSVFRQAALKFHPDRGGNNAAMSVLNYLREQFSKLEVS